MNIISSNQEVINYGIEYLKIVIIGCFGLIFSITFEKLLQGTGKTTLVMIAQATGAIINIVLDPLFINGWWIIPSLGVKGAAIATLIGQFTGCILGLILNVFFNKELSFNKDTLKLNFQLIKEILVIGIPCALMSAIGSVLMFLFNKVLLVFENVMIPNTNIKYGDLPQTVFGLYFKLNSIFFMPIFGINNAIVPIVAFNYGAKSKKKMMQTMRYGFLIVSVLMLIGTIAFLAIPDVLLTIFADSNDTAELLSLVGAPCLRIISSSFMIAAFCIVLMSMFQALGNGVYSMIVSFVRQLIILLPVAYLMSLTHNLNLVWLSYLIAEIVALIISIFLFIRIYNDKIKVLEEANDEKRD